MNPIQSLAEELTSKGYGPGNPISETILRREYALPSWVGVPPAFVTLVNEHLGTVTVGPEQETTGQNDPPPGQKASPDDDGPGILDLLFGIAEGLGGSRDRKNGS